MLRAHPRLCVDAIGCRTNRPMWHKRYNSQRFSKFYQKNVTAVFFARVLLRARSDSSDNYIMILQGLCLVSKKHAKRNREPPISTRVCGRVAARQLGPTSFCQEVSAQETYGFPTEAGMGAKHSPLFILSFLNIFPLKIKRSRTKKRKHNK